MVDVVIVDPNGEMPSEASDFIQVVRRFETAPPRQAIIDVDLFVSASDTRESLRDLCIHGDATDLAEVVRQAVEVAEERGIGTVYVADMAACARD